MSDDLTPPHWGAEAVEVTQADRFAAAKFMRYAWHLFWPGAYRKAMEQAKEVEQGKCDNWELVVSFARHRLASSTPEPVATTQAPDAVERLIASAKGHLANIRAHGNAEANACLVIDKALNAVLSTLPTPTLLTEACDRIRDMLEERAKYFDRTTGHFDRADAARSYRATAKDIEKIFSTLPTADAGPVAWAYRDSKGRVVRLEVLPLPATYPDEDWTAVPLYAAPTPPAVDDGLVKRVQGLLKMADEAANQGYRYRNGELGWIIPDDEWQDLRAAIETLTRTEGGEK